MYPVASPTTAGAGAAATPGSASQGGGLAEQHGTQRRNLMLNVAAKLLLKECRPARAASSSSVAVTVASSHADLTSRTRAGGAGSGKAAAAHPVTRGQLQSVHMPGDKLGHAVQTELRADSPASSSPLAGRKGLLALLRSASLFKADYDADGRGWSVGLDAELVWGAVLEAAQEEERAGQVEIVGQVGALREGEAVGGEEHKQSLLVQVGPGGEGGSAGEAAQPSTHAGSVGGGGSRWEVEAPAGSARKEAAQSLVQVGPAERGGAAREIRRCKHGSVSEPGVGGGRRGQGAGGQEEAKPLGRWGLSDGGGAASATGQERTSGHERTLVGDASMDPAAGAGQGSERGQTQIGSRGAGDEHAAIEVPCCSIGPARQPELREQAASVGSSAGQLQLELTALARQQAASAVPSGVHRAEQARSTGPDQHNRGEDLVAVAGSRAPGLPGLPWAHAVELVPGLESQQASLGGKKGAGAKTEAGRLGAGSSSGTRGDEASISGGERPTGARGSGSGRRAEGQVAAGGSSLALAAAAYGHGIFSRGGGRGPSGATGTGSGRGGVQVDGGVGGPASAALASCGEGSGGGGEPGASARGSRSSRRGGVQVVGRGGSLAAAAVAAAVAQAPRSLPPFAAPFSLEPSLPTGMVLLRSYLSVPQQAALVSELMALGKGPGGFLTPRHRGGGRLHLRMMCLGWHWESCTNSYEASRSRHDGATPPPIPDSLSRLTAAIIADANRSSGYTQPGPFKPDVCLVNLYDATGHLGFHQDKDESQASLRKGLPVVSISIGDAADMKFGMSSSESSARIVRLQSGDVLVFGGPSRMVYHSIPRVYPGTAPPELRHQLSLGRLNLTLRQIWV